jgi:hypothetical protein
VTKQSRRKFSVEFKAKVALEAVGHQCRHVRPSWTLLSIFNCVKQEVNMNIEQEIEKRAKELIRARRKLFIIKFISESNSSICSECEDFGVPQGMNLS